MSRPSRLGRRIAILSGVTGTSPVTTEVGSWVSKARRAFAALLEIELQVLFAVVDGDLLAGPDAPERAIDHAAAHQGGLRVRIAGVIDIARDVAAGGAVDGPAPVDLEQVFVGAAAVELLRDRCGNERAEILDDGFACGDRSDREQAQARSRAADAERPFVLHC